MATETADSLTASIAHATVALNDLRLQNADASSIDAAKKRLGELKKSMAAIASAGGSKDAGKKKERLLLKTAKVCPGMHDDHTPLKGYSSRLLRARGIMDRRRCSAENTSSVSSRMCSRPMAGALLTRLCLSARMCLLGSTVKTRSLFLI